jgi:hypothetical protein
MAEDFKGLNRLSRLQSSPLGSSSSLRKTPLMGQAGQYYRQRNEEYSQALRNLRRASRRGDKAASRELLNTRRDAEAEGYFPVNIRDKTEFDAGIQGRLDAQGRAASDMERKMVLDRAAAEQMAGGGVRPPTASPAPATGPVAGPAMPSRATAALDMLEGSDSTAPNPEQFRRGESAARYLGVENPTNVFKGDQRLKYRKTLDSALKGDQRLKYRKTLDSALKEAKTPEDIAALKERGARYGGVSPEAFDRRAEWWNRNR